MLWASQPVQLVEHLHLLTQHLATRGVSEILCTQQRTHCSQKRASTPINFNIAYSLQVPAMATPINLALMEQYKCTKQTDLYILSDCCCLGYMPYKPLTT